MTGGNRFWTSLTLPAMALAMLTLSSTLQAQLTISANPTAPTVDGDDIANLDLTNSFSDFQSSFMWPDRPARGQTFTTGSDPLGYTLDALTFQSYKEGRATSNYTLRVGSISGTAFTPIATETGSFNVDIAANDYVTFLLGTPLTLVGDTEYGFDVAITGSDGGFSDHGWGPLNNAQSDFPDGTAYTSGGGGAGGPTISGHNQDRIFHLNLAGNTAPPPNAAVPEPASIAIWSLIGLGLTGFCVHRARRKKS